MSLTITHLYTVILIGLVGLFFFARSKRLSGPGPIRSILEMASIPALRQALPELQLEIARARRLSHDLCVVVVRADYDAGDNWQVLPEIPSFNSAAAEPFQSRPLDLQEFSDCSRAFRDLLRELDCVAFDSVNDQFIVTLPGATHFQAVDTMNRISKHLGPHIANRLAMGIAEYPRHGLFLEDMIDHAVGQIGKTTSADDFEMEARA